MTKPSTQKEIWKDIKGYEGRYMVSNLARVKSVARSMSIRNGRYAILSDRILSSFKCTGGYYSVGLSINNKVKTTMVHRLVAEAFVPNPLNKQYVNHLDGIRHNNTPSNLEWCTSSENALHAYRVLGRESPKLATFALGKTGILHWCSKPVGFYDVGWNLVYVFGGASEAARMIGGTEKLIGQAANGTRTFAYGYYVRHITREEYEANKGIMVGNVVEKAKKIYKQLTD